MANQTWHQVNGDGIVSFRSDGHVSALVLRALYENGTGFDVALLGMAAAGDDLGSLQPIRAHKMILMHASKHLHELFTVDGYTDSHQTQYKLTEIGHESLSDIVRFIYTDRLNFQAEYASERMQKVLIGAKFLVMPDLANACETYLASNQHLNLQNCVCMLRFAKKYACLSLLDAVLNLAAKNLLHFIDDSNFLNLNENDVSKLLLSEPVITLADADQRCRAAVAWLNYDRPARDACVSDILNMVPFDLSTISLATLALAADNTAIRANCVEKCVDAIFDGAKKYGRQYLNRAVSDVLWNAGSSCDMWYVIGGANAGKGFLTYDVKRRYWSKLPDVPWTRTYAGACVMKNRTVFVFGGDKNKVTSADIDQYNLSTHQWTTIRTQLSPGRACLNACAEMCSTITTGTEQLAFLFGGFPADTHDLVEKFSVYDVDDQSTFGLERMPNMSVGRSNFAAVTIGDSFFVAGGNHNDLSNTRLSSIEKYDCVANKWSTVADMKCGRSSLMSAALGDDMYLAGGYDGRAGVDVVEVFNARTGQIRRTPSMLKTRNSGSAVALDRNTFCVIGGCVGIRDKSPCFRNVECFDVREGKWSTGVIVPDMPTANRNFGFAYV